MFVFDLINFLPAATYLLFKRIAKEKSVTFDDSVIESYLALPSSLSLIHLFNKCVLKTSTTYKFSVGHVETVILFLS